MHYVYVLQSQKNKRLYIGSSADVQKRLHYHNAGKVFSTRPYIPYVVIYTEEYETKKEALVRERQIKKSGVLRKYIKEKYGPVV